MDTNNYHVDSKGYYGCFGGAYVPEILRRAVETQAQRDKVLRAVR